MSCGLLNTFAMEMSGLIQIPLNVALAGESKWASQLSFLVLFLSLVFGLICL
jgi:hypothetical protein